MKFLIAVLSLIAFQPLHAAACRPGTAKSVISESFGGKYRNYRLEVCDQSGAPKALYGKELFNFLTWLRADDFLAQAVARDAGVSYDEVLKSIDKYIDVQIESGDDIYVMQIAKAYEKYLAAKGSGSAPDQPATSSDGP